MSLSRLPLFGVVGSVEAPAWLLELEVEIAHEWALELNELDPKIRDAVLESMP